jgi:hypothetical protein
MISREAAKNAKAVLAQRRRGAETLVKRVRQQKSGLLAPVLPNESKCCRMSDPRPLCVSANLRDNFYFAFFAASRDSKFFLSIASSHRLLGTTGGGALGRL